jgi:hypothetical protein
MQAATYHSMQAARSRSCVAHSTLPSTVLDVATATSDFRQQHAAIYFMDGIQYLYFKNSKALPDVQKLHAMQCRI